MPNSYRFLFVLSLFLGACISAEKPKATEPAPEHQAKIGRLLQAPIKKPDNKNLFYSLSKDFGKPQHQEFHRKKNAKQIEEKIYTLVYEGFEINIAELDAQRNSGDFYMQRLVLHDNVLKLPYGIKIGESKEKIQNLLGQSRAPAATSDRLHYCDSQAAKACVGFEFSDGRLERVIWDYQPE